MYCILEYLNTHGFMYIVSNFLATFFLKWEKDAECSETLKYVFGRISSYFDFFSKSYVRFRPF